MRRDIRIDIQRTRSLIGVEVLPWLAHGRDNGTLAGESLRGWTFDVSSPGSPFAYRSSFTTLVNAADVPGSRTGAMQLSVKGAVQRCLLREAQQFPE